MSNGTASALNSELSGPRGRASADGAGDEHVDLGAFHFHFDFSRSRNRSPRLLSSGIIGTPKCICRFPPWLPSMTLLFGQITGLVASRNR